MLTHYKEYSRHLSNKNVTFGENVTVFFFFYSRNIYISTVFYGILIEIHL